MKKYIGLGIILTTLSACGLSPEPDYYLLSPVAGEVVPDLATTLRVERPVLPGYLDRPSLVYANEDREISYDEMQRWAAPLDTMFADILAQDLRQRLPHSVITKEEDDLSSLTTVTLVTDIDTFNQTSAGSVLDAQFVLTSKAACATQPVLAVAFKSTATGDDAPLAQSALIARMADLVVAMLRTRQASPCTPAPAK